VKKRLNFKPEMQYKAPTKCGKSIGTREQRWALGGYKAKKALKQ